MMIMMMMILRRRLEELAFQRVKEVNRVRDEQVEEDTCVGSEVDESHRHRWVMQHRVGSLEGMEEE